MPVRLLLLVIILSFNQLRVLAQSKSTPSRQDTLKGTITKDREWWDLKYYAIAIEPDFKRKSIQGKVVLL